MIDLIMFQFISFKLMLGVLSLVWFEIVLS